MIKITNLCKRDIKNLNLDIPSGFNYLIGRNGRGKTTLLDIISGLDKDYTGEIQGNEDCLYLNQNQYFTGLLKVKDFVIFSLELANIKKPLQYFKSNTDKYTDIVDFGNMLEKKISFLSGGEIELLCFIIIAIIDRPTYIFDEPYAGVDEYGKTIINQMIEKLYKEGKTIILTSHETDFLDKIDGSILINRVNLDDLLSNNILNNN